MPARPSASAPAARWRLAAVHRITTDDAANTTLTENSFQADLGLEYTLTRHCTLTANYSFTTPLDGRWCELPSEPDFFGMQYAF